MAKGTYAPVRLSDGLIEQRVEGFRALHGVSGIPYDVYLLVERDLGIRVVPTPGLFRGCGLNGYTSQDATSIYIDQQAYFDLPATGRHTLAHEVGHLVLHPELWHHVDVAEPLPYLRDLVNRVDPIYRDLDWQADRFAGFLLMPSPDLSSAYARAADLACQSPEVLSVDDPQLRFDAALSVVCCQLAKEFEVVAEPVVRTRLDYARLGDDLAARLLGHQPGVETRRRKVLRV